MKLKLLELIKCIYDDNTQFELFKVDDINTDDIKSGILYCPRCNRWYPIKEGILSIMPDELRIKEKEIVILNEYKNQLPTKISNEALPFNLKNVVVDFNLHKNSRDIINKISEIEMRDKEAVIYDEITTANKSHLSILIANILKRLNINRYELVVDIGCGTGRTTTSYLDKCSKLVGVDFSFASLKVFNNKLKKYNNNNVYLIQGDATNLPLKDNIFNKALSIGVFSHIPTDNLRKKAINEVKRVLKQDKEFLLIVYNYNLLKRIYRKKYKDGEAHPGNYGKWGYHSDGKIYYYSFSYKELRSILSTYMKVKELTGMEVIIPKFTRIARKYIDVVKLDLFLQRTYLSLLFGEWLIAVCKKK